LNKKKKGEEMFPVLLENFPPNFSATLDNDDDGSINQKSLAHSHNLAQSEKIARDPEKAKNS
jgi:hypothetical protein